jgi:hypothetical protein
MQSFLLFGLFTLSGRFFTRLLLLICTVPGGRVSAYPIIISQWGVLKKSANGNEEFQRYSRKFDPDYTVFHRKVNREKQDKYLVIHNALST